MKKTQAPGTVCPAEIRIGTRGSPLAVAQAMEVRNRLLGAFPELTQEQIHIVKITTTGDRIQDRHLAEIGGKGLFTKELEEALLADAIDFAVHSLKDMPDTLPDGMMIDCVLEREDPRDAFISSKAQTLDALPKGAVVGTSSTRRQAQLLMRRPDLTIVPFRGNVETRLKKLENGEADATLLAVAGLKRLDKEKEITETLDASIMLPAVGQGAICIETLQKNTHLHQVLSAINHTHTAICAVTERAFLKTLGGSCKTPIAGYAWLENDALHFKGLVASPSGNATHQTERIGAVRDAEAIGKDAGEELLRKGKTILESCR